jgi:hypothetical protein
MTEFLGAADPQCAVGRIELSDQREKNQFGLFESALAVSPDLGQTAAADAAQAAQSHLVIDPRLPTALGVVILKSRAYEGTRVGLIGKTVYGHQLRLQFSLPGQPARLFEGTYAGEISTLQGQNSHYMALRQLVESSRAELAAQVPQIIAELCAPPPPQERRT